MNDQVNTETPKAPVIAPVAPQEVAKEGERKFVQTENEVGGSKVAN